MQKYTWKSKHYSINNTAFCLLRAKLFSDKQKKEQKIGAESISIYFYTLQSGANYGDWTGPAVCG